MPGFTKLRREIEPKWVAEYCVAHYPGYPTRYRCPLGPVSEDYIRELGLRKAIGLYRPIRPEVDALVRKPDTLILIEAKIFKYMDGLAKLPLYKSMIKHTPELKEHVNLPVHMQLLLPVHIDWVSAYAKEANVEIVVWAPKWVLDIWRERDLYWQKPATEMREWRKEILRRIGYE